MTVAVYADPFPEDPTSVSVALDRAARDSFVGKPWAVGPWRAGRS
jgi:hypothetical protein